MDKYRPVNSLAGVLESGGILKAQNVDNGEFCTLIVLRERYNSLAELRDEDQFRVMRALKHHEHVNGTQHIAKVLEVMYSEESGRAVIVQPLRGVSLSSQLAEHRALQRIFPEDVTQRVISQLCLAVAHLHSAGVVHRDIAPVWINFESDKTHHVLLTHLDMATLIDDPLPVKEGHVVHWYRAPESFQPAHCHGPPMDIWSCGVILFQMLSGDVPFSGLSGDETLANAQRYLEGTDPQTLYRNFQARLPDSDVRGVDLVTQMLQWDPAARISAKGALRHPYITQAKRTRSAVVQELVEDPVLTRQRRLSNPAVDVEAARAAAEGAAIAAAYASSCESTPRSDPIRLDPVIIPHNISLDGFAPARPSESAPTSPSPRSRAKLSARPTQLGASRHGSGRALGRRSLIINPSAPLEQTNHKPTRLEHRPSQKNVVLPPVELEPLLKQEYDEPPPLDMADGDGDDAVTEVVEANKLTLPPVQLTTNEESSVETKELDNDSSNFTDQVDRVEIRPSQVTNAEEATATAPTSAPAPEPINHETTRSTKKKSTKSKILKRLGVS